MQQPMVVGAQQDQVSQLSGAAVCPVADVVTLAMPRWAMTAGEGAAAVAEVERLAEWGGDQAALAAQVKRLALGSEDCGDEFAVAGVDAGFGGGDGAKVAEGGPADVDPGCGVEAGLAGSGREGGAGVAEHGPADAGPRQGAEGGLTGSGLGRGAGVAGGGWTGAGFGHGA